MTEQLTLGTAGHAALEPEHDGRGWIGRCACGWTTPTPWQGPRSADRVLHRDHIDLERGRL